MKYRTLFYCLLITFRIYTAQIVYLDFVGTLLGLCSDLGSSISRGDKDKQDVVDWMLYW